MKLTCKFAVQEGNMAKCSCMPIMCPYQYWCTTDGDYKFSGREKNCKYYEEAELQDTAEKTKTE